MLEIEKLVKSLSDLEMNQRLVARAVDGCSKWMASEDFRVSADVVAEIEAKFHSQKLCFRHEELNYVYIETKLVLSYQEEEIGYYCLYTLPDGEAVDDALVTTDNEFESR